MKSATGMHRSNEVEGPASGCLYFAVLYDAAMEDLFHKLQVPYEKKEIKLEERCRLKLLSGTHHHASSHRMVVPLLRRGREIMA